MPTPTCPSPAATPASRPAHRAVRHFCPPQLCAALALCVQVLALLWPAAGHAHMMSAQQGTLNVVDNAVFGVLALPVSALDTDGSGASLGADANGDGRPPPSCKPRPRPCGPGWPRGLRCTTAASAASWC